MSVSLIVSLIGEQPIPILLPLRHLKPAAAVLVHTDLTKEVAERLKQLFQNSMELYLLSTDPYDIGQIQQDLRGFIQQIQQKGVSPKTIMFNLTGGTKPMMIAAYEIAREFCAPFLYLQSEGQKSLLYRYRFEKEGIRYEGREEIPSGVITIDDYLRAHVGRYQVTGPAEGLGGKFEEAIKEALKGKVDEVLVGVTLKGALEVDLVVRCGNQIGVIAAKTGNRAMEKIGLDQLSAACEQRYLGTYTRKILVVNRAWPAKYNLRELADVWKITVIHLTSFTNSSPSLSPDDQRLLVETVCRVLGG